MWAAEMNISNIEPRRDADGYLMDIHDGNIVKWGDTYYWYGMGYQVRQIIMKNHDALTAPLSVLSFRIALRRQG